MEEDESLGLFVLDQEKDQNIYWNVSIPHGGSFSANQKRRLDTPKIFKQFLAVALGTSESRKIICRMVQKDPNTTRKSASTATS
jgi:hypothetical protein